MSTLTADQNNGHGYVFPRPDGVKARCGGPALCPVCARDLARQSAEVRRLRGALDRITAIYCATANELLMQRIAAQALGDEPSVAHADPTGKTREPPHCPTCSCGMESPQSPNTYTVDQFWENWNKQLFLMPDGTTRPIPAYYNKPQTEWTEDESKAEADLQKEIQRMQASVATSMKRVES